MGNSENYRFLSIIDAMASINQRVNLLGVVVDSTIPRLSKGTDYFCNLKIIDESRYSPGISVTFFAENMEKLPHVESSGDIIQLSHVVMKNHGPELFVLFNKKFSSFALFQGRYSDDFSPYQASLRFQQTDQDKKFISELRKWMVDTQIDIGLKTSSLREIREGERIDLVCKILHSCEVAKDEWMVFVWDGTDTPPTSIHSKLEDEMENPLPLQVEPSPLSREILSTFPSVGSILRIGIGKGSEKLGLHLLVSGRWVIFPNLKCEVQAGLWCGVLMPSTRLRFLPTEDPLISYHESCYDKRLLSKLERMPLSSFPWPSRITETDYDCDDHVPFATLMDVLVHTKVTAKFRCVARVVAAFPWEAKDFRTPTGTYRIRLTLEDPTARIHAFLYAEDGETFFEGYPSDDVMRKKRNKLLGISEDEDGNVPRNPPWVQLCIKSYYLVKNDPWQSRNYRIFGTKFIG